MFLKRNHKFKKNTKQASMYKYNSWPLVEVPRHLYTACFFLLHRGLEGSKTEEILSAFFS